MANSVNTNVGALVALSSLRVTNSELDKTSKRIQTGFRVADASDDAAVFAVAQGIRGNIKAYASVQSSLAAGEGLGQVTAAALTGISNLVADVKAKFANLADGSLTSAQRTTYQNDAYQLIGQINNFINQATYNGKNLLNSAATISFVSDVSGSSLTLQTGTNLLTSVTALSDAIGAFTAAADYSTAMGALTTFEGFVNSISAQVAAQSRSLSLQRSFVNDLVDATKTGLGALVDADVAAESAALQSLQVRQQLGVQALSIANQQPNTLLSLFR
ncbi:flagellin [Ferrovibrio sp.]|uniref:flagellin n=1 Tax=Ferrovibrio sp. TaxID=1917215 RepID=UPI0025BF4CAE|nr:flagellin [Ferrovibrio sp.]MBX3454125.1 hypothetical protein [Ferrovibrio sp.]